MSTAARDVLSAIPSTPECEKWLSTFELFNRACVTSLITISLKAQNVEKRPCLPSSRPKPAHAEKFPRSMIPLCTCISGNFCRILLAPVEPSKSESMEITRSLRASGVILASSLHIASATAPRKLSYFPQPLYSYGSLDLGT